MYRENLKSYYSRYYRTPKTSVLGDNQQLRAKRKLLEEDSEDDEFVDKKRDQESWAIEQRLASFMFLVTVAVLLGKLYKLATEKMPSMNPQQWLSSVKFPEFRMTWWEGSTNTEMEGGGGSVKLLLPLCWGIVVTVVTWMMVYFDSNIPGVDPKPPSLHWREIFDASQWNSSYFTAIICGFFVFLTMIILEL